MCYIDVDKLLLAVFMMWDVELWKELCFSYYGDIDVSKVYRSKMWLYWWAQEKWEEIEQAKEAREELVCEHSVCKVLVWGG